MLPTASKVAMLREIRPPQTRPFTIEEVAVPALTEGAILGRMRLAGICGTDVHILHGKVKGRGTFKLSHPDLMRDA
jgi:D-arabinose 1-dehydrogenase-like Zn-dependent alcohol dehydrogenase